MRDEGALTRPQLAERWRRLLETATRIPSPHNVQPWQFRLLDESHAEIHIEKRRTLPEEDKLGSFIVLTMGTSEKVKAELGARDIWLVFRIGRSPEAPWSRRRSLEELLLE